MHVLLDLDDEPLEVSQMAPAMDEVNALIDNMERNLLGVPSTRPAPMETLGECDSEFTAVGGEGIDNAGRSMESRDDMDQPTMDQPTVAAA